MVGHDGIAPSISVWTFSLSDNFVRQLCRRVETTIPAMSPNLPPRFNKHFGIH
jgi:hypothetical protein